MACGMPPLNGNEEGPGAGGSRVLKDRIPDGTLSTQVTLPNMECDNCTLQFIQVMTDKCPYTTNAASDDIYFNCADLTLSNSAPVTPPPPDPSPTPDAGPGDEPAPTGGGSTGGCSTTGGQVEWALLALAAIVPLSRRRRR